MAPLVVIGVGLDGPDGLSPEARAHVARAEVLAGAPRHQAYFPHFQGERIVFDDAPCQWIDKLKARPAGRATVVLATGDPLYFGIGRLLIDNFARDELEFVPHVSSPALAFARLRHTWNDACVISLHGRPLQNLLPALLRGEPKIAVLTDATNNPDAIAQLLMERGLFEHYVLWVCENLDGSDEQVRRWAPELRWSPLNVVILLAKGDRPAHTLPLVGIPESMLRHCGEPAGLITRRALRLQALCLLELYPGDVFWDIGAGSGSVSLEAARLAPSLRVFAIERDVQAQADVRENIERFGLANVQLQDGEAPHCLTNLPDPDAVFIGGSGGQLVDILDHVVGRLCSRGRLVLSCVTLETLTTAWSWLSARGLGPEVTSFQTAHSGPLGRLHALEPERPHFLLHLRKT